MMKIDWHKVKYIKGVLPYLHRAAVPLVFIVNYLGLWLKIRRVKGETPGRKVVVINLFEHFGDIVACEPVARYARRTYPDAFILWSVRKPFRELVEHNSSIDGILTVKCLSEWILLRKSGLFDEIIDLYLHNRECPICRRPLRKDTGNTDITTENYYNYGNLLGVFCQGAGIPALDDSPRLTIPQSEVNKIDLLGLPGDFIVVHCVSNDSGRNWDREKWRQLVENVIRDFGIHVVEIGLQPLLELDSARYVDLCGKLSLLGTAEVIRRARLFVGIDSGPAHLANAIGTFGIVLLGRYSNFDRYMPYSGKFKTGENARIIYAVGPAAEISVDTAYNALSEKLA